MTLVATIAVSTLAYRQLGSDRYGLLALLRSVAQYFVLFASFGLDVSLLRFLPLLQERGAPDALRRLALRTFRLQTALVLALWLVLLLVSKPLWRLLDVDASLADVEQFRVLLMIAGGLGAALVAFQAGQSVCLATFWTKAVTGATLVRASLWSGAVAVVLALGHGVGLVVSAEAVTSRTRDDPVPCDPECVPRVPHPDPVA